MSSRRTFVVLALHLPLLAAPSRGRLEHFSIESKAYGRERLAAVYTRPGYAPDGGPYPLVICFDSMTYYQGEIPVPDLLDEFTAAGKLPPMVAVFVDTAQARLEDLANNRKFAQFSARN